MLTYHFQHPQLLLQATTHSSKGNKQFQRLEFLGDRVLGLALSLILFDKTTTSSSSPITSHTLSTAKLTTYLTEGDMAKQLSYLASAQVLTKIALQWNLAIQCAKQQKHAILADVCEAVLGAIYIDCQYEIHTIKQLVHKYWQPFFIQSTHEDSKTALQEKIHNLFTCTPKYTTHQIGGQSHSPTFSSTITITPPLHFNIPIITATAIGPSKKEAEKLAASNMLELLSKSY